MTKRIARLLAVVSIVTSGLIAVPAAAHASGTLYPSGCVTWANDTASPSWGSNCWIGSVDLTGGNYVTGVQRILAGNGSSPGSIDGVYGTNTSNAIKCFQGKFGLSIDGIVGTNTWQALRNHIYQLSCGVQYCDYWVGDANYTVILKLDYIGVGWWYTYNRAYSALADMDVNGPA